MTAESLGTVAGVCNTRCGRNSWGIFGMWGNFVAFACHELADGIHHDAIGGVVVDRSKIRLDHQHQHFHLQPDR